VTARPTSPQEPASTEKAIVFIIDDDASVREALKGLLQSAGFRVKVLNSASEFLQSKLPDVASCLIFDIGLAPIKRPRRSGRFGGGRHSHSDHRYHQPWRYPNDGQSDEGGGHRLSYQAVSR
jgi:hypothetical protein